MSDYFKKIKHGYYLNLRVPKDVQKYYLTTKGKPKEYLEDTLATRDITVARLRALDYVTKYKKEFAVYRAYELSSVSPLDTLQTEVLDKYRQYMKGEIDYPFGEFDPGEWWNLNVEHLPGNLDSDSKKRVQAIFELFNKPTSTPLDEVIDKYLKEQQRVLREATINERRQEYKEFSSWVGYNKLIDDISKQDAGKYVEYLCEKVSARTKRLLSSKTIRDNLSGLSSLFKWAEVRGYCKTNPFFEMAKTVPERKVGKRDMKEWSPKTIKIFLQEAKKDRRILELFSIALYTGMRGREVADLKATSPTDRFLQIDEAKNSNSIREVAVHPVIQPLITKLRAQAGSDGYLIRGLRIAKLDNNRYKYIGAKMGRIRKKLGISGEVDFHSTRRSISTAHERAGLSQDRAARLIGHKPNGITFGLYSLGLLEKQVLEQVAEIEYGDGVEEAIRAALTEVCGVVYDD